MHSTVSCFPPSYVPAAGDLSSSGEKSFFGIGGLGGGGGGGGVAANGNGGGDHYHHHDHFH